MRTRLTVLTQNSRSSSGRRSLRQRASSIIPVNDDLAAGARQATNAGSLSNNVRSQADLRRTGAVACARAPGRDNAGSTRTGRGRRAGCRAARTQARAWVIRPARQPGAVYCSIHFRRHRVLPFRARPGIACPELSAPPTTHWRALEPPQNNARRSPPLRRSTAAIATSRVGHRSPRSGRAGQRQGLCGHIGLTAVDFLRRARNVTMPKPAANSGSAAGSGTGAS